MTKRFLHAFLVLSCLSLGLRADDSPDVSLLAFPALSPAETADIELAGYWSAASACGCQSAHCGACSGGSRSSGGSACGIVPSMIGDTGLLNWRIELPLAGTQAVFHNHIYKVAENNSAVPQNRFGFNFNYLDGVFSGVLDDNRLDRELFEYRFFVEKTVLTDALSVDFMIPFYYTSDYNPGDEGIGLYGPQNDTAFGDLAFGLKGLLLENSLGALSAGLRVEAPTNDDIVETSGTSLWYTTFDDDVWHFTPYAALLVTPSERLFMQSFLSYRLNTAAFDREPRFPGIRDQTYLMADLSVGYWLVRRPRNCWLTGLVPLAELHYTGAFDEESLPNTVNNLLVGHSDVLNLTAGVTAYFRNRLSMTAGIAVPLRDNPANDFGITTFGSDRRYDWSLLLNVNYHFGR